MAYYYLLAVARVRNQISHVIPRIDFPRDYLLLELLVCVPMVNKVKIQGQKYIHIHIDLLKT